MRINSANLINFLTVALFLLEPELRSFQLLIEPFNSANSHLQISYKKFSKNSTVNAADRLVHNLVEIFKFTRNDIKWFGSHFNLKSLELLYPKGISQVIQLKRCVLGVKFKQKPTQSAAVKLEFDNQVRSRFDENSKMVVCSHQTRSVRGIPTERYIANLVQSNPFFIKYYPQLSKQFSSSKVNSYVYIRLPKSSDLLSYTKELRASKKGAHNSALENLLRKHFGRMHQALTTLKRLGFAYTDFKPENVLVDSVADIAYLIDLESVVSVRSRFVCVRTLAYSPPLFTRDGQLMDIDGLSQHSVHSFFNGGLLVDPFDRILSWTFCFSIYILMCQRPAELSNYARLGLIHDRIRYWVSDVYPFVSYFGCKTGPLSKNLTDMLNFCLVRKPTSIIFPQLIKYSWLSDSSSLGHY